MSNNTTPPGAPHQQPPDDSGICAVGSTADGVEAATGGGMSTQPEFVSTHSSSECKKLYVDSGNDKTILYVLSIGLEHDSEPLFSLEQEPWSTLSKNALRPPKNSDLVKEVKRRATASNMRSVPRPSNWTRNQIIEWLEEHPVSDSMDVQFLTFEVLRLQEISRRMQQERQQFLTMEGISGAVMRGGNWRGCVPYLRVIMTLTRDDVKSLFLSRGNCSRTQLDGRNSDNRPKTCYELIAELWNSSDFNPKAPPSRCHSDFVSEIDCSHAAVVGLSAATAVKIADIFTSMRCKLLTIIRNWEASGQGDGGMDREQDGEGDEQVLDDYGGLDRGQQDGGDEEDDNNETSSMAQAFVSLRQRPARALDNRAAFLRGMPSYILYYWEVAESQQLLSSCLQRLSNHANASDASSVALVSRRGGTTSSRSNITSSGGSSRSGSRGGRSQNADEETDDDEMTNTTSAENPLVQSLQDLVDSQRRLLSDRALDREHQERENTRKRRFDRRSFLVDETRMYRMKIAEFSCVDDDRSRRMLQFYTSELSKMEEEIRQLDDNNDK
ncbi:hypothetical protein MHU86_16596 [Fragilaria crotonensis]|nr:hypothetical protein MHU86_16596 [Fragilaria crotonensis]